MMMLTKNCTLVILKNIKTICTTNSFFSSQAFIADKDRYYKNIGVIKDSEKKPEGWETALAFEKIPGPKPLPLIGNGWRFVVPYFGEYYNLDESETIEKLHKQFGKIVAVRSLPGVKSMINLSDPDDIEQMYKNGGAWPERELFPSLTYYKKVTRKDHFKDLPGFIETQGEEWFNVRTVANKILLPPKIVQQYVSSMDEVASDFVKTLEHLSSLNKKGEMPETFQNELHKWALESIAVVMMDKRLDCLNPNADENSEAQKLIKAVLEMFRLLYELDGKPSLWRIFNTPNWKKYVSVLDFIFSTTQKNVLDSLKNATNSEKNNHEMSVLQRLAKINPNAAISASMDLLIGGIDTTGRILGSAMYFLARNESKQSLLRSEVLKLLPEKNTPITSDILQNAKYLKACIKETMRIAPVASGSIRRSMKDMVLGGYQVPKGTILISSNLFLCRKNENYLKATEFIPERWLRTTNNELSHKNTHSFVSLPFGFGPRSCIGRRFANLELEVALLRIIRNFQLTWPHEDMVFKTTVLHGMAKPFKVHIKPTDN